MNAVRLMLVFAALLLFIVVSGRVQAQTEQDRIARIAEIEIDPHEIEPYKEALREEIADSIRLEPGVLTLYAVSIKGHPEQVRIFEVYANQMAYEAHLRTPQFNTYKTLTPSMVRSLKLIEVDPISLGAKK